MAHLIYSATADFSSCQRFGMKHMMGTWYRCGELRTRIKHKSSYSYFTFAFFSLISHWRLGWSLALDAFAAAKPPMHFQMQQKRQLWARLFLYVSLGMGSASRNQPATLKFQQCRFFEFLSTFAIRMDQYYRCTCIMFYNQPICFEARRKCSGKVWSVILFT